MLKACKEATYFFHRRERRNLRQGYSRVSRGFFYIYFLCKSVKKRSFCARDASLYSVRLFSSSPSSLRFIEPWQPLRLLWKRREANRRRVRHIRTVQRDSKPVSPLTGSSRARSRGNISRANEMPRHYLCEPCSFCPANENENRRIPSPLFRKSLVNGRRTTTRPNDNESVSSFAWKSVRPRLRARLSRNFQSCFCTLIKSRRTNIIKI